MRMTGRAVVCGVKNCVLEAKRIIPSDYKNEGDCLCS
jgi:hypothetical protein